MHYVLRSSSISSMSNVITPRQCRRLGYKSSNKSPSRCRVILVYQKKKILACRTSLVHWRRANFTQRAKLPWSASTCSTGIFCNVSYNGIKSLPFSKSESSSSAWRNSATSSESTSSELSGSSSLETSCMVASCSCRTWLRSKLARSR